MKTYRRKPTAADGDSSEGQQVVGGPNDGATIPATTEAGPEAPVYSTDLLPCVETAASTINASQNEVKNFMATADFIARQVVVQLSEHWRGICKTARSLEKEGASAKVKVGVGIDLDLTNILMMDTKVKMSYSEKHQTEADTQANLAQTEFNLKS